jgi:putative transposase
MAAFHQLHPTAGITSACMTLGINQRTSTVGEKRGHRQNHAGLNRHQHVDCAPATIYATLLDEGRYHSPVRTMYRVLESANQTGERRRQRKHPVYTKPELLAIEPNQVWSWDITKIKGPIKWSYFHLYVILDIFSRYVVGWMIALRETAELAKQLIAETVEKQYVDPGTLTLHADRGTSMPSKPVAALLVDLDVTKTHSRPHISDDNPFSEAQFKTLKYRPDFPERFGSIEDARAHCQAFFDWYNTAHRHSGIGYMTPHAVHHHEAVALNLQRAETLNAAFIAHPRRFRGIVPKPPALPTAAWINPPKTKEITPLTLNNTCTLN